MNQMGMKLNTITSLDELQYGYFLNSNQLKYVHDNSTGWNSTLGDFKEVNNNTSTDYAYDDNGNLIQDNNKSISSIDYNYLNLPSRITINGKGTISYIYDASGNKIQKIVDEAASSNNNQVHTVSTTSYFGPFEYLATAVTPDGGTTKNTGPLLQSINMEEGRIRPATPGQADTFFYDYFEKDHLGNVRVVLTDQLKQDVYPVADVESQDADALTTEKQYYDIQDANIVDEGSITAFNGTTTNEYQNNNGNPPYNNNPSANTSANSIKLYKLNGAAGVKTGLGITLRVMSGDVVDIFGKSFYHTGGVTPDNNYPVSSALLNLLNAFAASTAVGATHTGITGSDLNNSTGTTAPLVSWLDGTAHEPLNSTMPKAFINWVFMDEQFNTITGSMTGCDAVSANNNVLKNHHQTISITRNGYLYVYCSNESDMDVFFDNLQLIQTHGPLIEETHYYPFGLTMAGISSKALSFGGSENKKGFSGKELQNKEFSDGSGLNEYDFGWRLQDPQLGVWHNPDPLADKYNSWSPYTYTYDNPLKYIDPNGKSGIAVIDEKHHKITVKMKFVFYGSQASENVAQAAGDEVVNQYNGAKGTVTINGEKYKVKVKVNYTVVSEDKAKSMAKGNTDARLNFVRVEVNNTAQNRSFFEIGGNSGFFNTSDNIGTSTTVPHEVGHGFGLLHSAGNQIGQGQSDIMAARGTLVDPQYQYDPKAAPGAPGGTINPAYRVVTQGDITDMFKGVTFGKDGTAVIGSTVTNYIYDANGNVIQK